MAKDKYDEAIEYLRAHPDEICEAWGDPDTHPGGRLFDWCGESDFKGGQIGWCGCLTQIRASTVADPGSFNAQCIAPTPSLTADIRGDTRIPTDPQDITVEHLQVFADWQRKLDALGVR
jgi:hypothetical protein